VSIRLALSLFLCSTLDAAGQTVVTEADFLAGLTDATPAYRADLDRLGEAEAALARARQLANPRVEYGREQPDGGAVQDTFTVAWTPPLDGRRGLEIAAARASLAATEAGMEGRKLSLRLRARAAYARWSTSAERRTVIAKHHEIMITLARQARLRAQHGEESGLAAGRIGLAEGAMASELADAEARLAAAEALVRAWRPDLPMGAVPDTSSSGVGNSPTAPAVAPRIEALRREVEQARLQERLARRFWTAPELQGGWQRQEVASSTQAGPVFGVAVSIPILDRGRPERVLAARRRVAAEARLALAEQRRAALSVGASAAFERLSASASATRSAADTAPRLVEAALASFNAGEATVTDVLDTLRAALDARLRATETQAAAMEAAREMEAAAGALDTLEER
jgi:outer membrane protein TolC